MAIATLLIVTPTVFAAPAAPSVSRPADPAPVLAALRPVSLATRVIASARSHLGARYLYGAQGPRAFDCSGLVLRAFADAGLVGKLGGWGNRSGFAIYAYGRRHHLVSTTNGQPGDVVVWGGGRHVGIYLGHGMAISALVEGVRIHGIHAVTNRFTAFVHMGLTRKQASSVTKATAPPVRPHTRHAKVLLRVRSAPSTAATTVDALPSGARLLVRGSARDSRHRVWYRVTVGTLTGWVAGWLTRP
jgi:cell wall-associated NlpC family hydrolase